MYIWSIELPILADLWLLFGEPISNPNGNCYESINAHALSMSFPTAPDIPEEYLQPLFLRDRNPNL